MKQVKNIQIQKLNFVEHFPCARSVLHTFTFLSCQVLTSVHYYFTFTIEVKSDLDFRIHILQNKKRPRAEEIQRG